MSKGYIDVSVVTFNSSRWINPFMKSILNQDYPTNKINLYFTDNSSTDSTYQDLLALKNAYEQQFNQITVFLSENNGFGSGHNNNVFHSQGEFVLVSNIDLTFERDAMVNIVKIANEDNDRIASWEFRQKPFEHPKLYNPVTLETNWSSSACILFRRSAFEEIKGYDDKIFMYGEDVDISYRLRDHGYKLKYYPKAVCWHYTYEYENQVKPMQFLGSTSANVCLRIRFGSCADVLKGMIMYLMLFFYPEHFKKQRIALLKIFFKLMRNFIYFFTTRKKSDIHFGFLGWDYEKQRDGAFYEYEQKQEKHNKTVSVIIRTYANRMGFLKEAVQSIVNQTYPQIEIVIIEDGSNYAEKFAKSITAPNIVAVKYHSIEKSGRCRAGNVGLSLARGEYLAFLDDDDLFFADHLEVVMSCIEKENVVAAYANGYECRTRVLSKEPLCYEEVTYNVFYHQEFSRALIWHNNYIPIQTIVFNRKLYDEMGGFDLELENLEDWNLWTRYSFKHNFKYIHKTTSLYRVPADNLTANGRQEDLDKYYAKAIEKQEALRIENISVKEFMAMHEELNKELLIFIASKDKVKTLIKKYAFLNRVYYFMRKIYYKFLK